MHANVIYGILKTFLARKKQRPREKIIAKMELRKPWPQGLGYDNGGLTALAQPLNFEFEGRGYPIIPYLDGFEVRDCVKVQDLFSLINKRFAKKTKKRVTTG